MSLDELRRNLRDVIWWTPEGGWNPEQAIPVQGVLAGSFNPLHEGHRGLLAAAAGWLGGPVVCELSIENADKPPLEDSEIRWRCGQFGQIRLAVTRAATFAEKSRLFPGVTFVVGADTAARIVSPRFYGGDTAVLDAALTEIAENNCRFLVAARMMPTGLLGLDDLAVPRAHTGLFTSLPSDVFRLDVSSSQIRRNS